MAYNSLKWRQKRGIGHFEAFFKKSKKDIFDHLWQLGDFKDLF